jgi:hypothetical protein
VDVGRRAAAQRILGFAVVAAIVLGSVTALSMRAPESGPPPAAAPAVVALRPAPSVAPGDLEDPRLTAAASSCFTALDPEYARVPNFEAWVEALHRNSDRITRSLISELQVYASKNDKLAYKALDCTLRTVDQWRHHKPPPDERSALPGCPPDQRRSRAYLNGAQSRECLPDRSRRPARADMPRQSNRPLQPPDDPGRLDPPHRRGLPDGEAVKPERSPERSSREPSKPESSKPARPTPESSKPDRPRTESSTPESSTPESSTPESSTPESSESDSSEPDRPTTESSTPESSNPDVPTTGSSTPQRSKPERSASEQPTSEQSEPEQ